MKESYLNCELVVEFNVDMPIVGTSSSEKQSDASAAESLQGDKLSGNGCTPLKRRSQQDLEEARAEMRVKVQSGIGLSCISFNKNGVDPTMPLRGVNGCQDTSVEDELTKEQDGLRSFVQADEISRVVGNGTDLTDLLRDLDDSGDSEDVEDEFGGDPPACPSLEADVVDELTGNSSVNSSLNETEVQAETRPIEPIVKAVELQKRDSIGTEMHAHGLQTLRMEEPPLEVIMLDSDSDDDNDLMFDHLAKAPQNTAKSVKSEPGGLRQVPNQSAQLANSVPGLREVQIPGIKVGTLQNFLIAEQQQLGTMVQFRIANGKLEPYLARIPMNPQNIIRMSISHPGLHQASILPYLYPSGCSTSFAPNIGYAQEVTSFGERAGRKLGLSPSSPLAAVPSSGQQAEPKRGLNPSTMSAAAPPTMSAAGYQPGPSHIWNFTTNTSAVGASKAKPGLCYNTYLGPQIVPAHNQPAVVKRCYDSTVCTSRLNVARAMQQYDFYITKAKNDRVTEAFARTEATPNELLKEGHRRGLECRPDIVAYNEMKREIGNVNPGITVGDLPGVEIGDKFTYRHQMAVVGLHRLPNAGIDYGHPPPDMIPTATAIVLMPKAGYVDDKDYGNTILYTGQGGRKKRNQAAPFVCDQELKKGNLALAKNFGRKLPVRVIRGHSILGNKGSGVLGYTYDGLYMITNYEFSLGLNGFSVYKYSLERIERQPPIPPCIAGCTAHEWNKARLALGALPLHAIDPPVEDDVKHLFV